MKTIKSILLFIATCVIPLLAIYVLLDGVALNIGIALFILAWASIYIYIDKFILMFLNAREVIDTDEHDLFQKIKNESYKSYVSSPRVYLYSGQKLKCFVLESRTEWAVVLDRNLLKSLNSDQLESIVSFLFEYKKQGHSWYQTKAMGICTIFFQFIYWSLNNLLFLKTSNKAFKLLSLFLLCFLRPFWGPIEVLAKRKKLLIGDESLRAVFNQMNEYDQSFMDYLMGHLNDTPKLRRMVVEYLESYPVLENSKY